MPDCLNTLLPGILKMKRFCLLAGIALTWSASTFAQDNSPKPNDLFKQLDRNSDGKLVADEIPEAQARFFERLVRLGDADKNGELTQAEFDKATSENGDGPAARDNNTVGRRPGAVGDRSIDAAEVFKRLDKDGDGKLSKNELPEFMANRFAPLFESTGKDAFTLEEFQQLRQKLERGRPEQGQQANPAEVFKRLDANGDGTLTIEESSEPGRRIVGALLERSGKGRDGSLTLQEFEKAAAEFGRKQQGTRPNESRRPQSDGDAKRSESDRPARDGDMQRLGQNDRPQGGGPAFLRILDANHDGRLSRDELAKAVLLLEQLDQNGDGSLDMRELFGGPGPGQNGTNRPRPDGASRPAEGLKPGERSRDDKRPDSNRPRPEGRPQVGSIEENFERMDRNKDGVVNRDEAPERLRENFDRVDSNSDGKLSLEELRKVFEQSRLK
jgi:Ca2+-binding EF-hand superfamily protein